MFFREEDKEKLKNKIKGAVWINTHNAYIDPHSLGSNPANAIQNAINHAISDLAIQLTDKLVNAIVNELYTHENFEQDIGLRDK